MVKRLQLGARCEAGLARLSMSMNAADEFMEHSRAVTVVLLLFVWIDCLVLILVVWVMPIENYRRYAIDGLCVAFAAIFGLMVRRRTSTQLLVYRRETGRCLSCGYDLHESRVRCPECGKTNDLARGITNETEFPASFTGHGRGVAPIYNWNGINSGVEINPRKVLDTQIGR